MDYGPVIVLVERNLEGLQSFIREARKMTGIAAYQAKADEIAGLKLDGVYSFAGARAAVLRSTACGPEIPDPVLRLGTRPRHDWRRFSLMLMTGPTLTAMADLQGQGASSHAPIVLWSYGGRT